MAQLSLGKVVPDIEITEVIGGKSVKFTTATQEVETTIKDGIDGVSPISTLTSTGDTLTVTIVDAEGTKTVSAAKGTTIYYTDTEPENITEVGSIWI